MVMECGIHVSDVTLGTIKVSVTWKHPYSPREKKFKAVPPPRKFMATVFVECGYGA
jgi:hypothetical protein